MVDAQVVSSSYYYFKTEFIKVIGIKENNFSYLHIYIVSRVTALILISIKKQSLKVPPTFCRRPMKLAKLKQTSQLFMIQFAYK